MGVNHVASMYFLDVFRHTFDRYQYRHSMQMFKKTKFENAEICCKTGAHFGNVSRSGAAL